jgi:protein-tyrosine kinase
VKNATHAQVQPGPPRLFDLRATTAEQSFRALVARADARLIVHPKADPAFVEQYRHLGVALHQAQLQSGTRSVMIASAVAGEGKTLSATNLALMLSGSFNKRVLLVDADLRKPSVHQLFQLENSTGLGEMLMRRGDQPTVHALSPTLSVMTGGHPHPDPVSLFVADTARPLLAEMHDRYDWVIVDTAPVVLFPDAGLLAGRLDTCVMVVRAATAGSVASAAVAAIGASRILGVVLNRAERSEVAAGYGYGSYDYPGYGVPLAGVSGRASTSH